MQKTRTTVAAVITLSALAVLTAFALRPDAKAAPAAKVSPAAQPVQVRTVVIRRTIRIVRHEKPFQPRLAPSVPLESAPVAPAPLAVGVSPKISPARLVSAPVSIRSSGSVPAGRARGDEGDRGGD